MSNLLAHIRDAAAKRIAYTRLVAELAAMPTVRAVEDLGIFNADARAIARQAVYGR